MDCSSFFTPDPHTVLSHFPRCHLRQAPDQLAQNVSKLHNMQHLGPQHNYPDEMGNVSCFHF